MGHGGRRPGAGRKKGSLAAETIENRLQMELAFRDTFGDKKSPAYHITRLAIRAALTGDASAVRDLADRYMGRPKYAIEHGGIEGGEPIAVTPAGPVELIFSLGDPARRDKT